MIKEIFVNVPVKNLTKSMRFFSELGFNFNKEFTDKNAACLILGKNIFAMLLTEPVFKSFSKKEISNLKQNSEAILAVSLESRKEVDEMLRKAIKAGGKETGSAQDHGWMYSRSFEDLDGHTWEPFYADNSKRTKQK